MAEINPMTSYDLPASTDPVIQEMQRVGAQFPNFRVNYGARADITGAAPEPGQAPPVNLTAQESEALIKRFASRKFDGEKTVREFLAEQIADPNYKNMPRQAKQQMFDQVLRGNNQQAFEEFKATHPDVAYRYATSGLKKILSATDPAEREELEREYLQGQNEALQSENEQLRLESADKDMENYNQTQPETTENVPP
jgi:predicted transcriptional regulator